MNDSGHEARDHFVSVSRWALMLTAVAVGFNSLEVRADVPIKPNVIIILADDKYSHAMYEPYLIHENQRFSRRMTDFWTTPNSGQFSPIL